MKKNYRIVLRFFFSFCLVIVAYTVSAQVKSFKASNQSSTGIRISCLIQVGSINRERTYYLVYTEDGTTDSQLESGVPDFSNTDARGLDSRGYGRLDIHKSVSGLKPNTLYRFQLYVLNSNGVEFTSTSIATRTLQAPVRPIILGAEPGYRIAVLSYAPFDRGPYSSPYVYLRKKDSNTSFSDVKCVLTSSISDLNETIFETTFTKCKVSDLEINTEYEWKAIGKEGLESEVGTFKTKSGSCLSVNLRATSNGYSTNTGSSISVYWNAPYGTTVINEIRYRNEKTLIKGFLTTWGSSTTINYLEPNTSYLITVFKTCLDGSNEYEDILVTTSPKPLCLLSNSASAGINTAQIYLDGDFIESDARNTITYSKFGDPSSVVSKPFSGSLIRLTGLDLNTIYVYSVNAACKTTPLTTAQTGGSFQTYGYLSSCPTTSITKITPGSTSAVVEWNFTSPAGSPPVAGVDVCLNPIGGSGSPICFNDIADVLKSQVFTGLMAGASYNAVVTVKCSNGSTSQASQSFSLNTIAVPCPTPSITNISISDGRNATVQWDVTSPVGAPAIAGFDVCINAFDDRGNPTGTTCNNNLSASTRSSAFINLTTKYTYTAVLTLKCSNNTTTTVSRSFTVSSGGSLVRQNTDNNAAEKQAKLPNSPKIELKTVSSEGDIEGENLEHSKLGKRIEAKLSIIPNPTKGDITILLSESGYEKLTITNMNGQVVKQVQQPADVLFQKMDCMDLPMGIYILSAKGAGKMVHSKFVKN
jgi:Secretion system C-terminal sorting domain